jgi:HEAT repeat protein
MEATWGGRKDTAGPVRSAGALALARSAMPALDILTHLVELLADPEVSVRVDAARAIGHLGTFEAIPPLRLKALLGDTEPEVTGQCLASLLRLDEAASVPFALRFTASDDNALRLEALAALALAPGPEAFAAITRLWPRTVDTEASALIVRCLGASPLADAESFLLDIVTEAPARLAAEALTALAQSRFHASASAALKQILQQRGEPTLTARFNDYW